ncbi:MAG: hypothetical protein AAGB22_13080, partial [Bacteroidota bacterium]
MKLQSSILVLALFGLHIAAFGQINSYPYTEDFESGAGSWTSGGTNSSWALGTPNASVINTAAPGGTQSWATNLSGNFNGSENSFVESPTFDMSALGNPQFRMDVWWDSETSWSGAQVQVSSNGGTSWTTLGSTASGGTNWYPEGSANGNMNTFFTTSGGVDDQWSGAAAAGSGGWVTAEHPLTGVAAQSNVKIRVVFGSDASTNFNGFAFDNIEVFNGAIFEDLAVQSIDSLSTACGLGVETVTITLRNEGSDTIQSNTAIPVTYSDGATTVSETLTLASDLLPQATITHTFATPVDLSVPGFYTITAYADLAADTLPANDTAVVNLENILLVNSYPHF